MLIPYDPDGTVTEVKRRVCEHHQRMPWDTTWAGCTCSSSYSTRQATAEERAANIKARQEEQERRRKHIAAYDASKLGDSDIDSPLEK